LPNHKVHRPPLIVTQSCRNGRTMNASQHQPDSIFPGALSTKTTNPMSVPRPPEQQVQQGPPAHVVTGRSTARERNRADLLSEPATPQQSGSKGRFDDIARPRPGLPDLLLAMPVKPCFEHGPHRPSGRNSRRRYCFSRVDGLMLGWNPANASLRFRTQAFRG
jgi:hypothetical protein